MNTKQIAASVMVLGITLSWYACSNGNAKEVAAASGVAKRNNDSLVLNQQQINSVNVDFVQTEERALEPIIYANGKIALLPDSKAEITSHISGKVEKILVREGQRVAKGQPLLTISSFDLLQMQNDYVEAHSDVEFLEAEFRRQDELRQKNIGVLAEYQSVKAKLRAAKAREIAYKQKLELLGLTPGNYLNGGSTNGYLTMYAPISGFVSKFFQNVGSVVTAETVLAEIVNPDRVEANVYLYEQDAESVKEGLPVKIEFVQANIPSVMGKVLYISRTMDAEKKTITLHVSFPSPGAPYIIAGDMNIRAQIAGTGIVKAPQTLPNTAIYADGSEYYVFVTTNPKAGSVAMKRMRVEVLEKDENFTSIKAVEQFPSSAWFGNNNILALEAERKKNEQ